MLELKFICDIYVLQYGFFGTFSCPLWHRIRITVFKGLLPKSLFAWAKTFLIRGGLQAMSKRSAAAISHLTSLVFHFAKMY